MKGEGIEVRVTPAELAEVRAMWQEARAKHPLLPWESFLSAYCVLRAQEQIAQGVQ